MDSELIIPSLYLDSPWLRWPFPTLPDASWVSWRRGALQGLAWVPREPSRRVWMHRRGVWERG